jgi:serine/threonine protein kinase
VAHATDQYDLRSVVSYGAFGVLYRLIRRRRSSSGDDLVQQQQQQQQQIEDKKGLLLVRRMQLRDVPADRSETFVQEIKTLQQQHQQQHPPPHHHQVIAPIVAYARSTDTLEFVYHLPPGSRSLAEALRCDDRGAPAAPSLSWIQRFELLLGVAAALHVLHNSTAATSANGSTTGSTTTGHRFHGDVSSKTIYVANNPTTDDDDDATTTKTTTCSVCLLDGALYRLPVVADPLRYLAGDVLYGTRGYRCPRYERGSCRYDWASDMFAFGIVAAEVLTGRLQLSKQQPPQQHEPGVNGTAAWDVYYECVLSQQPLVVDPILGPPPVPEAVSLLGRIIGLCLHPNVHQRPSAALVVTLLAQLVQDMRSRCCPVVTP